MFGFKCFAVFCRKSVVVGAGYIAVEMAQILQSLGSDVTLIIRRDEVLRSFDEMLSKAATEEVESSGVKILRNSNVKILRMSQLLWSKYVFGTSCIVITKASQKQIFCHLNFFKLK